ncbi:ankyrin repeat-containing protein BDA1 isoform X2 [Eucalyptus grandis]|uniref:ankyrin repeat-containing protein BDA1 isoform X2 n=1 Tax=Eucalyptus grandis TaxID=71139 RepID=UPI0008A0C02F|nr:ankyrin repeat-containing protein BDA1 isoform X2 [Eucalyptus grandis]
MASDLHIAAVKGNVPSLLELLAKDKLLLDRIVPGNQIETPLHIAALLGHLDFVEEVLARKAELAKEKDSLGSTPLHLASTKGHLNIVVSLLRVDPDLCFFCDNYERNPLHIAAIKGHVDVLEYLVRVRPDAARRAAENGQTIMHLCVTYNRLDALRLLIDILGGDLINSRDVHGNTILHLAGADGDTKTMLFLTNKGVKPNIKNSKGFTALDLLAQSESEERKRKWQNNMQKTLMVVATLLATMTYQAGITPPGGLWEGDSDDAKSLEDYASSPKSYAGESVMAFQHWEMYQVFLTCNTISFIASLSIMMLFISGLPLKRHRITTWLVMLTMWVAITFAAATYAISISEQDSSSNASGYVVLAWIGLMAILFLCHFIRLIVKLVRKVRGCICQVAHMIANAFSPAGTA